MKTSKERRITEEHKANIRKAMLGRKHSKDTRLKMSASLSGRKLTNKHKINIGKSIGKYCSDPNNKKKRQEVSISKGLARAVIINGVEYCSMTEAGRHHNLTASGIRKRCESDNFYGWKFVV